MRASPLPPERPGRPADPAIADVRRRIAGAAAAGLWATDPAPAAVVLGGVPALRFDPPGTPRATLVHFHGGAFRIGAPEQVARFAAALAARCGVAVVCPRYRLAPEHPFPAALNDGLAVLAASAGRIVLSGDSAGGGLAASLAALRVAAGAPPAGLVLLSAWLDLRVAADSYAANAASDPMFSRAAAQEAAALYLQGAPAADPRASPLLADPAGFPPTLVNYGSGEVLADDARAFAAALDRAGVAVRLHPVAEMEHVAVTRDAGLTGAAETFAAVAAFVAGVTGGAA